MQEMRELDVIEASASPWSSPIVLVNKKDGSTTFCVDYHKLNDITHKDSYPLPRIDETIEALSGAKFSRVAIGKSHWMTLLRRRQLSQLEVGCGNSKSCHSGSAMPQQHLRG